MWKKKLIFFVTFFAGLYFLLEFVVPPTWPGSTTAGVVKSVNKKVIDEKTKTSDVTIELTAFRGDRQVKLDDQRTVNVVTDEGTQPKKVAALQATNVVDFGNGDKGVVTRTNKAFVTVSLLGGPKTLTARVVNGKSSTLAFKVDESGGEQQLDDPGAIAANNVITKIGPSTYLTSFLTDATNFIVVLGSLAWGYALFSLWFVHTGALRKRTGEWYMSILFFVGLAFGIMAGCGNGTDPHTKWQWYAKFFDDIVSLKIAYTFFSATFSILSFYLASAAYRSFKIKSREAALMMSSALIVMLGQIPFGIYMTSWIPGEASKSLIPKISQWLQLVPNTAGVRGIWFGMMLAIMAISLRFWLSLERGAFFDREL